MKNESDNPSLVPFNDRNPSPERLYHTPGEMSDEQFALLAAAWAEEGLDDESISEIETIFKQDPDKKIFAEGFKSIRLKPGNEKWNMRDSLLRTTPYALWARRSVITLLAAAAVITLFITVGPLLKEKNALLPPNVSGEIQIAAARPLIKLKYYPPAANVTRPDNNKTVDIQDHIELKNEISDQDMHISPMTIIGRPEIVRVQQQMNISALTQPKFIVTDIGAETNSGQNWIVRGMMAVADLVRKDDKPLDKYNIAGACVKGVNNALGWEMELEKVMSENGKPVAISFSSSLLSFRSPVKKSVAEQ